MAFWEDIWSHRFLEKVANGFGQSCIQQKSRHSWNQSKIIRRKAAYGAGKLSMHYLFSFLRTHYSTLLAILSNNIWNINRKDWNILIIAVYSKFHVTDQGFQMLVVLSNYMYNIWNILAQRHAQRCSVLFFSRPFLLHINKCELWFLNSWAPKVLNFLKSFISLRILWR